MAEGYLQYFAYSSGWITTLAVAGNAQVGTLNIAADADFQANYMTITIRQAGLSIANFGGDILITDSARGRQLFNVASAIQAFAGNGQLPYPFNPPRLFRKNSSIVIVVTNPALATATDVQIVFHGNKIYESEPV